MRWAEGKGPEKKSRIFYNCTAFEMMEGSTKYKRIGARGRLKLKLIHSENSGQARSPRMRRASWMSRGMMVTRFACMAHRFVSSKRWTR
jgi:hypothetical protein